MAEGSGKHVANLDRDRQPTTIAGMLMPFLDAEYEQDAEKFRIKYEKENGPTDLTRRYTSVWPEEQQEWLFDNNPEAYFDGLPSFAKAWHIQSMKTDAREGSLDLNVPQLLKLYVSGFMEKSLRAYPKTGLSQNPGTRDTA